MDKQAHLCKVQRLQELSHVDSAGIDRRLFILPGEISHVTCNTKEKSAEVILVNGIRAPQRSGEDSQVNEGLNIKLFQMLHGAFSNESSHALGGTEN